MQGQAAQQAGFADVQITHAASRRFSCGSSRSITVGVLGHHHALGAVGVEDEAVAVLVHGVFPRREIE